MAGKIIAITPTHIICSISGIYSSLHCVWLSVVGTAGTYNQHCEAIQLNFYAHLATPVSKELNMKSEYSELKNCERELLIVNVNGEL